MIIVSDTSSILMLRGFLRLKLLSFGKPVLKYF